MLEQVSLFAELENNNKCFYKNIEKSGFEYEEVNIGDITFKPGQSESVHRWYRLTPSYSPNLVRFLLKEFGVSQNNFVFDPFSGRGTTTIECQKKGIPSLGIEVNPLLKEVGNKSLLWSISQLDLFDEYIRESDELLGEYNENSIEDVTEKFNTRLPIIHNVFRWWKKDALRDLIICRELIFQDKYSPIFNYLWLAVNKAALDCANIHRNHPTITFDDDHQRKIDVYFEITENLKTIKGDLLSLSADELSFSNLNSIVLGNSTCDLENQIYERVDFVITSPPYPNRYSYVHQTRPQLHFMELLEDIRQATEIDLNAVGGTWGRATSILQNSLISVPDEIMPFLSYYEELKEKSVLMCNYATKYFIDLLSHIRALKKVVNGNFRGAYVVGNSRLSDVEIFTEVVLGKIFELEGFKVEKIISFRKRGGRQRLYETAVCVRS
jgi:hypothetical protein